MWKYTQCNEKGLANILRGLRGDFYEESGCLVNLWAAGGGARFGIILTEGDD